MPATTPLATGKNATTSAATEPNASSSSAPISTVPAMASWRTSVSMRARLCTANTGGPLICNASPASAGAAAAADAPLTAGAAPVADAPLTADAAPVADGPPTAGAAPVADMPLTAGAAPVADKPLTAGAPLTAWSNDCCSRSINAAWPSRSAPEARVCSSSKARGALRDTHTPCWLRGALPGSRDSAMRWVSPVGSRASSGLTSAPAGVPSSASVSSTASRSPAAVKRWALTAGLRW